MLMIVIALIILVWAFSSSGPRQWLRDFRNRKSNIHYKP